MVGNALEVMPLAMHFRLSFTNTLPCKEISRASHMLALAVTPM